MLVNTLVGYVVVQLPISALLKFVLIFVLTIVLCIVIYEGVQYGKRKIESVTKWNGKEETLCMK